MVNKIAGSDFGRRSEAQAPAGRGVGCPESTRSLGQIDRIVDLDAGAKRKRPQGEVQDAPSQSECALIPYRGFDQSAQPIRTPKAPFRVRIALERFESQNALAFWTPKAPFRVRIALERFESIPPVVL